jgi:hypothetical protein
MNFTGFPLYSNLVKEIDLDLKSKSLEDNSQIPLEDKKFVMNNIKKIDKQHYEYIYCLILSYYIDINKKNVDTIPYEGKQLKSGIKLNFEDLPNKLQRIIYTFISSKIERFN